MTYVQLELRDIFTASKLSLTSPTNCTVVELRLNPSKLRESVPKIKTLSRAVTQDKECSPLKNVSIL